MRIVIMDAQGGGLGKLLVAGLKKAFPEQELICVGTNAMATAAMLRAGADRGATGENAVLLCAREADIIAAPLGMVLADAMLGEVTAEMARAVGQSRAQRVLVPVGRCDTVIAGTPRLSMQEAADAAVREIAKLIGDEIQKKYTP